MSTPGPVLGIDLWASSVATARARVPDDLANVSYVAANAQTHRPATAPVDVVISRFGLMFFDDPTAAFANLASWLRPAAGSRHWCGSRRASTPGSSRPTAR